jgi:hypothetical protein
MVLLDGMAVLSPDEAGALCCCVRVRRIIEAKALAVEQLANGQDQGVSFVMEM